MWGVGFRVLRSGCRVQGSALGRAQHTGFYSQLVDHFRAVALRDESVAAIELLRKPDLRLALHPFVTPFQADAAANQPCGLHPVINTVVP